MHVIDLPHYTYDNYCSWEGDWELINGIAYAMAPSPTVEHQNISTNILVQLHHLLEGCEACKALIEIDYKISDDTVVRPDVLVACEIRKEAVNVTQTPRIIFEVLSASTKLKDRTVKLHLFAKQKVPYFVLVDPKANLAEVYRLTSRGTYKLEAELVEETFEFEFDACRLLFAFKAIWEF